MGETVGAGLRVVAAAKGINRMMFDMNIIIHKTFMNFFSQLPQHGREEGRLNLCGYSTCSTGWGGGGEGQMSEQRGN